MTADNPGFPIRKPPVGPPPTGGGAGHRHRSRYAPDDQVKRAARLAVELGLRLKLGADGSVEVLGRLDTPAPAASVGGAGEGDGEGYEAWKQREGGVAGR